jgi:transcriptional regulator with XRE-family HTH domain
MKSEQPTIGRLLRGLRAHRGWTLKQMSAHSGIPLSTLSKVEHDRLTLTYDKLQLLSQRLNMTMSELFAEPDNLTEPAVTARRSIGRIEGAVRVKTPNYDYYYLCPELRRKRMIPVLARVRAKSLKEFGELVRHSGEEWAYVVEGTVVLHTEFYDPLTLKVGESVYIDSNMGHAYLAGEDCDEATVVCACSSPDEALMESLIQIYSENKNAMPRSQMAKSHQEISKTKRPKLHKGKKAA